MQTRTDKFLILNLFFLIFMMLCFGAKAQYYNLGQDPASLHWRQIKTEHFRIIYPQNFENNAQHLSNMMEDVRKLELTTLKSKARYAPIILHNQTIVANAFTVWTPRRMEFYTCPPQNSYAQDWMEQLAIHEYRHYLQMDKLNEGFTKYLNYLTGEHGTAIVLGLYVPLWLMEGDAVCTETLLSRSGRGRIPSFEMELRSNLLNHRLVSYDKAIFGSYRDYVPDYYMVGYPITAFARMKYGADVWDKTLSTVARKPFIITPFNRGLKKNTGLTKVKLYRQTMLALDSLWQNQENKLTFTPFTVLTHPKKGYWKYKFPQFIGDSLILAERSGLDDISRFILMDKHGNEKVLFTPGFYSSENISVAPVTGYQANKPGSCTTDNISIEKGMVAWAEKIIDARWAYRNYSVIKTYDIHNHKVKQLTFRSRLFAPALSPDAKQIVAVRVDEDNRNALVILDASNGNELKEIVAPAGECYLTPTWNTNNRQIVVVGLNAKGKYLATIDLDNGNTRQLLAPGFTEIANPKPAGHYVFFDGDFSGIDNIYAVDTLTTEVFQVTSAKYGASMADINRTSNAIIYSDYSPAGYRIARTEYNPAIWKPLKEVNDNSIKLYKSLQKQENGILDNSSKIPSANLPSQKYNKTLNLFNFHSWAPAYIDIDNIDLKPGISLMSQNLLSTMFATAGWDYDPNWQTGTYHANISYQGWYPIVDFKIDYGERKFNAENPDTHDISKINYFKTELKTAIRLPLDFTTGKFYQHVEPQLQLTYTQLDTRKSSELRFRNSNLKTLDYRLYTSNFIKSGVKDLYPKWGQSIEFNYRDNPFNAGEKSSIFASEAKLFFPGIANHHSLWFYGGYQKTTSGNYLFSDFIRYPRGYTDQSCTELYSLKSNYKLPLIYPDLSLGSLVYIKRIKANLFYDYGEGTMNDRTVFYRSTGIELTTDVHLLRFLIPFDLGIRSTFRPDNNSLSYEFLFAFSISGL